MTMNPTFLYKLLQLFDFAIKCPLSHSGGIVPYLFAAAIRVSIAAI